MSLFSLFKDADDYVKRAKVLIIFVLVCVVILVGRLWHLQIIQGSVYYKFSRRNSIAQLVVPATRGIIYDNNGNILVDNRPSFNLILTRAYIERIDKTAEFLNSFLHLETESLEKKVKDLQHWPRYKPFVFYRDLDRDQLAMIESNSHDVVMNGVSTEVVPVRYYKFNAIGSHLFGYLGEINSRQLKNLNQTANPKYRLGSYLGKFGIEKKYEKYLRGTDGIEPVEIDAHGKRRYSVRPIEAIALQELRKEPVPGLNLNLTIDMEIQEIAYNTFEPGETGSLVAINPANGAVLAMVSVPSFDPSIFATRIDPKDWQALMSNPEHPLQDKILTGMYAPASTYKTIVAIAALEEGIVSKHDKVTCKGGLRVGNRYFRCWQKHGHGKMNITRALIESCDVFFYKLGLELGVDKIAEYARKFGLGEATGISLNNEKSGLVPTAEWKLKYRHEPWQLGETPSIAIGQGFNLTTPMQLARMIAIIANKGKIIHPTILRDITNVNNQLMDEFDIRTLANMPIGDKLKISSSTWDIIHEALFGVVNDKKGTAYWFSRSKYFPIAGKTGTAQVISLKSVDPNDRRHKDHALFVAFAPLDDPKIAVAVIVEHGEHGSSGASPKAKAVIEAYLSKIQEQDMTEQTYSSNVEGW